MNNIKKILLPVDIFMENKAIAGEAAAWAKNYGGEIVVLHVIPKLTQFARYALTSEYTQNHANKAAQLMEEFIAAFFTDSSLKVESKILEGYPSEVISTYAKDNDIDLIIMATRQLHDVNRFFLGSVTGKVIALSPVPVLAIPPKR